MGRKRRFESWAAAEEAETQARKELSVYEIALKAMANNVVKWIDGYNRKVGTCYLDSPHGGVVIVREYGMISAYYVDEWCSRVQGRPAPATTRDYMPEYRSWLDAQELATKVKEAQRKANEGPPVVFERSGATANLLGER